MAAYNPFRYRGYRYDGDTRLYYLQSRYYDPAVERFINADKYAGTGQGYLGYNMFAYCNNNPVNAHDANGDIAVADDILYVVICIGILVYTTYAYIEDDQQVAGVFDGIIREAGRSIHGTLIQEQEKTEQAIRQEIEEKLGRSYARSSSRSYRSDIEIHHIVARTASAARPARTIL